MNKTIEGWNEKEWEEFKVKLEQLTLSQLKQIAKIGGIDFVEGTKATKEDYILILDEIGKERLTEEYEKAIKSNK